MALVTPPQNRKEEDITENDEEDGNNNTPKNNKLAGRPIRDMKDKELIRELDSNFKQDNNNNPEK
eukprot:CAMPEP_0176343702 /NCGR_PEP_ID=MMETSP0126-20121128/4133_1 /TAXON_ID=141414 ORGANISM="Strombidinopsis acuminatum, Strain SPMC142" /NCGR_SAMPLE_ID=MMETSP0126 /ASSEMBLY_ACC=CAM_ASM_000229 /LENGTH=64 /DNA_ID=CAMNT_0017689765 /DNA_START=1973 /DNA_END=2167 /DNA_ORIENTATION=+